MENQQNDQAPAMDNSIAGRLGRVFQYVGAIMTEVSALLNESGLMRRHGRQREIIELREDDQGLEGDSTVLSDDRFN